MGRGRETGVITLYSPPGSLALGERVTVSAPEEHHLHVRRAGEQVELRLVDGAGTVAFGRLEARGTLPAVTIERLERVPRPPAVTLAVGAGDRDRFATVAEKAVELGATRLVPLETERSLTVAARLRDKHVERLQRRALEALKQCGGAWLTEVTAPIPVADFLAGALPPARWLADPQGEPPPALSAEAAVAVAVGPEGGFTVAEVARFRESGFLPVCLGPHLLRFETAAIAALSVAWARRQGDRHG